MKAITPVSRPINVVGIHAASALGFAMPKIETLEAIPHAEHAHTFGHYQYKDVWTAGGWLITAIEADNVTCHVRKGVEIGRIYLEKDTAVYVHPFHRAPEDVRYLGNAGDVE